MASRHVILSSFPWFIECVGRSQQAFQSERVSSLGHRTSHSGTLGALARSVEVAQRVPRTLLVLCGLALAPVLEATVPDAADHSIRQFLAQDDAQPPYRATRRLEVVIGDRSAWLEAVTEYSPQSGFTYEITAEGGSEYIRSKVLRAILDGERDVIAQGETARSSLVRANYSFQPNGIDEDGLANVLLSPRRKERVLVSGRMFLQPDDGRLVRLEGQLAKSPSFWVKNVEIVRTYERIEGAVVPVVLQSNAQVRLLGDAALRMTYSYSHINGHLVGSTVGRK